MRKLGYSYHTGMLCYLVVKIKAYPSGQNRGKSSHMALYFECRINENALLQIVFWRFCPLG